MDDFEESEIFDHVEQFLLETHAEDLNDISGAGRKYDINSFRLLRKFINHLNDKYHTGLGVVDGHYNLKRFSTKKVEEIFKEATKVHMSYGEIIRSLKEFVFFLNEMKLENLHTFRDLEEKADHFVKFLKKIKKTDVGKKHANLLSQIEEKFVPFHDSLEFYIQQSIGFDYKHKESYTDEDTNDELYDLGEQLREFRTLVKKIKVVKKQGLPQLIQKYIQGISNKHYDHKQWNSLVKVIAHFPLHISTDLWGPEEIRNFLVETANLALLSDKEDEKEEFIAKIKMLFQKVLDKKMEGGSNNRVITEEMQKAYKKKMIIEIFRYNLQGYYSDIVAKFGDLIKQKYIGQLNIVSSSLRQSTNDLKQIFNLLTDDDYIQEDLKTFINIIRSEDEYKRDEKFQEGLRFKFQYIKQEVDNIIRDAKESEYSRNRQFTEDFIQHIRAISNTIGQLINYIRSLERKDFDLSEQEIKSFQKEIQSVNVHAIHEELQVMLENIITFINVSHMYQNIDRTRKELNTIDLKKYQDQSVKMFIDSKNDMQKYYKELYDFFQKEDTVYNPTLALYMKETLLKFHSCLYISKGISCHPIINPRYFTNPYENDGTNMAYRDVAALNALNQDYFSFSGHSKHKHMCQLIGITEELGARQFKGVARYQSNIDIFGNPVDDAPPFQDFLPKLPDQLQKLQLAIGETNCKVRSKYESLRKYYDVFDIYKTDQKFIPKLPRRGTTLIDNDGGGRRRESPEEYLLRVGLYIQTNDENADQLITRMQLMGFTRLGNAAAEPNLNYIKRLILLLNRKTEQTDQEYSEYLIQPEIRTYGDLEQPMGPANPVAAFPFIQPLQPAGGNFPKVDALETDQEHIQRADELLQLARRIMSVHNSHIGNANEKITAGINAVLRRLETPAQYTERISPLPIYSPGQVNNAAVAGYDSTHHLARILYILGPDESEVNDINPVNNQPANGNANFWARVHIPVGSNQNQLPEIPQADIQAAFAGPLPADQPGFRDACIVARNNRNFGRLFAYNVGAKISTAYERVLSSDIQLYLPQQIQRILLTKFGVVSKSVNFNNPGYLQYIRDVVKSFIRDSEIAHDPQHTADQTAVLCLNDESLKEYLLPEIQIPFIQPFMKLFNIQSQNKVQGPVGVAPVLAAQTQSLNQILHDFEIQVPKIHGEFDLQLQQNQYDEQANIMEITDGFRPPVTLPGNILSQWSTTDVNWTTYRVPITSIFGAQCSVPVTYTPKGIFGTRFDNYTTETFDRFSKFKSLTEVRQYGLFDRCNFSQIRTHGNNITTVLDALDMGQIGSINNYLNEKRNVIFHPIDTGSVCSMADQPVCINLSCPVPLSKLNTEIEYQMYLSQQLQYFSLQGNMAIFDPMVRRKLFTLANTVYRGQDILPGLGPQMQLRRSNYLRGGNVEIADLQQLSLYFILARPFGLGGIQRNQRLMTKENQILTDNSLTEFPNVFYQARKGSYNAIPEDFADVQPRVPIPVILKKCKNNLYRNKLIDLCDNKCPEMIENNVLRVSKDSIDKLIQILNGDTDGLKMRAYLSMCIQIQYHNNYQYMRMQPQIADNVELHNKVELEQGKLRFIELVKKVINIKQVGNAALIVLTDMVNNSINEQVNQIRDNKKINYKSLIEELNNLIVVFREQSTPIEYFKGFLTEEELRVLTTNNHYLNNYRHSTKKAMSFTDSKYQMLGGDAKKVEHNGFEDYFRVLDRYVNGIKDVVHKLPVVQNFAHLFSLIATHEGNAKSLNTETVKHLISQYMIASMIDINESVLEFDFSVDLQPIKLPVAAGGQEPRTTLQKTQLNVDVRQGKSLKLITPDCIFVPIVLKATNTLTQAQERPAVAAAAGVPAVERVPTHNIAESRVQLVPQFTSRVTRDFDQLFNQLINAMSQRMMNHIGLYRFTQKKQLDESVKISRIMLGVGKRSKKSRKSSSSEPQEYQEPKLAIVDNRSEMSQDKFELYFRCYLLVMYYYKFFDKMNKDINKEYQGIAQYLLYHFSPDSSEPEGRLFQMLNFLKPDQTNLHVGPVTSVREKRDRTLMSMEDLMEFMRIVDKIGHKHGFSSNDQYYSQIIQFVNKSFGIITNVDRDKINNMLDLQASREITLKNFIDGFNQPQDSIQVGDSRLSSLSKLVESEKEERNTMYTNMRFIIEKSIGEIGGLLDAIEKDGDLREAPVNSIHKYIRNQFKLLKLKNADISEFRNNLLYIINNLGENSLNDIQVPLMFHEQFLFTAELYNRVKLAIQIKDEFDNIDDHMRLGFVPPPVGAAGAAHGGYANDEQLAFVGGDTGVDGHKNKHTLTKFINKLADQYSLFADSNLITVMFNNNPMTVDVAAGNEARVCMKTFEDFKKMVIIEDDIALKKKLEQLKTILSSIHANTRFDSNRRELYEKQQQIISHMATLDWRVGAVDATNVQRVTMALGGDRTAGLDSKKTEALRVMIGQGRLNVEDSIPIQTKFKELITQTDGDIPMQDNVYYRYNTQEDQKEIQKAETISTEEQKQTKAEPVTNDIVTKIREELQNLGIKTIKIIRQTAVNQKIDEAVNKKQDAQVDLTAENVRDFMLVTKQIKGDASTDEILQQQVGVEGCTIVRKDNVQIPQTSQSDQLAVIQEFGRHSNKLSKETTKGNAGVLYALLDKSSEAKVAGEARDGGEVQVDIVYMYLTQEIANLLTSKDPQKQGEVKSKPKKRTIQIEGFEEEIGGNGKKQGKGLGADDLLLGAIDANYNITGKLQLERPFFFNYNIYEAQLQQNDEVFVFNRLLKEFFISCRPLTGHIDLLGKLFVDQMSESRGTLNLYYQTHGRDVTVTSFRESATLNSMSKLSSRIGQDDDVQFQENIVKDAIKYSQMVNDVLYDGYHEIKDQFTCMDIEIHNRKHLENAEKLQTLSVFTSSIYNFFGAWAKQQELTKQVPLDLMTQLNMKFNNEDLQILVANAVFTKFKLQGLLEKINFKQKLLEHVAQQIFMNHTQKLWNIDNHDNMPIRQYLTAQSQYLIKLRNTIQHKIIFALDIIINNKHNVLPPILQQGSIGNITQPLLSNLFFLIDTKKTLMQLQKGNLQDDDEVFKMNFARYLYTVMNKHGSDTIVKQLSSDNQYEPILRFHDLITLLAKQRFALHNTILNTESYYAKAILLVPHPDLLKYNPEQIRNVKIPADMNVKLDGPELPANVAQTPEYIDIVVKIFQERQELLENQRYVIQQNGQWQAVPNGAGRAAARAAIAQRIEERWSKANHNVMTILNLVRNLRRISDNAELLALEDAITAVPLRATQSPGRVYGNSVLNPAGIAFARNDCAWFNPEGAAFTNAILRNINMNRANILSQQCQQYQQYLNQYTSLIERIGVQIYGYKLDVLAAAFIYRSPGELYLQYRHFFGKPTEDPVFPNAYVRVAAANRSDQIPIRGNNLAAAAAGGVAVVQACGFIGNYMQDHNHLQPAGRDPIQSHIRALNSAAAGFQVLPYVYCRREIRYADVNNIPTLQTVNLNTDATRLQNTIYVELTNYDHGVWVQGHGNLVKQRMDWQGDALRGVPAAPNVLGPIIEQANLEDVLSTRLPIRIKDIKSLVYQSNPLNRANEYTPFSLQYCLPTINRGIFEQIVKYLSKQNRETDIEKRNIVELGLVPLNLQMLKKESGLVNISLYASAFQEYLNKKFINPYKAGKLPQNTPLFDLIKLDLGISDALLQKRVPVTAAADAENWPSQMSVLEHIINNTQVLPATLSANTNMFALSTKFDQMRQSLQFRVALFLYLILTEMIGGSVKPDRDIELKGIEALISGQMLSNVINTEHRKY